VVNCSRRLLDTQKNYIIYLLGLRLAVQEKHNSRHFSVSVVGKYCLHVQRPCKISELCPDHRRIQIMTHIYNVLGRDPYNQTTPNLSRLRCSSWRVGPGTKVVYEIKLQM
jgi:hypothetical protein